MKIHHIIYLLVFIHCSIVLGQVTLQYKTDPYATPQNFVMGDINSDFGIRGGNNSIWHRGIDLNPVVGDGDKGYQLITPVTGTIAQLTLDGPYYYIVIKDNNNTNHYDIGYGHIFDDTGFPVELGGMIMTKMNDPDPGDGESYNFYAIIEIANNRAFSSVTGTVTHPDVNGGNPLNVTNQVQAGWAIAVLGMSDATGAHLHLYRPADPSVDPQDLDNAKDPCQILNFTNTPFNVSINYLKNVTEKGTANYFGGNKEAVIQVKAEMTDARPEYGGDTYYNNSVMNIDNIYLKIKRHEDADNTYAPIKGSFFYSTISHGARIGTVNGVQIKRYPADNNPVGNNDDIAEQPGSTSTPRTGIIPHAYGSNADGYDEYVFSKIYTRIHKNDVFGASTPDLALTNQDARYPDGDYDLRASVVTVKGDLYYPKPPVDQLYRAIAIDNFRPYIRKIEIMNPDGIVVYTGEWKLSGSNLVYTVNNPLGIDYRKRIIITIWPGEKMRSDFTVTSSSYVNIVPDYRNVQGADKYTYSIAANDLDANTNLILNVSGHDYNGNAINDLPNNHGNSITAASMFRGETGAFSGTYNANESYTIVACNPSLKSAATEFACSSSSDGTDNMPFANFSFSLSGTDHNIATFTNASINGDYYYWDFGDGEVSHDRNPSAHAYTVEAYTKTYNLELTVTNTDGETDILNKKVTITGYDDNSDIGLTGNWQAATIDNEYLFYFNVSGDVNIYSLMYEMDYGDGSISSNPDLQTFTHVYPQTYNSATYYPVLTVFLKSGDIVISQYQLYYDPVSIHSVNPQEVALTIQAEGINSIYLFPDRSIRLTGTAQVYYSGKQTFIWSIHTQVNRLDGGGPEYTVTQHSITGTSTYERAFGLIGEYLITLNYFDEYGNEGYKEYIVNIGYTCAQVQIKELECAGNFQYSVNSTIKFWADVSGMDNCGAGQLAKIEWFLDDVSIGSTCNLSGLPNTLKCITFKNAGKHRIMVVVNPSTTDGNKICTEKPSFGTREVNILECDKSSNMYINNNTVLHEDMTPSAGSIYFCNTSGSSVTVTSGEYVKATARRMVQLKPGFKAFSGSTFKAVIDPCPSDGCKCDVIDFGGCDEIPLTKPPTNSVTVDEASIEDDPYNGCFDMWFNVDAPGTGYIGSIYIYFNSDQSLCSKWDNVHEGEKIRFCYKNWTARKLKIFASVNGTRSEDDYIWVGGLFTAYSPNQPEYEEKIISEVESITVDTLEDLQIKIYPNPSNDQFVVEIDGDIEEVSAIEVYNTAGQRVSFIETEIDYVNTFNVSDWFYGVYFVRITTNNGYILKRFVRN